MASRTPERTITLVPGFEEDIMAVARRLLPEGFRLEVLGREELPAKLPEVEFILSMGVGWLDDATLLTARKLKLLQLMSVGYDSVNTEGARRAGIPVAVNGGANAISVAEHTVMFLLALMRRLNVLDANVRAGKWRGGAMGSLRIHEIWSQTIGIVGMGRIGQNVAARLRPFEPGEIIYYDPVRLSAERERSIGVRYAPLDELLATADAVTLHVPLAETTRRMIDAAALGRMKSSAILVNTARGELIDEPALVEALRTGQIAGAGLDVFAQEPCPPGHPLYELDNVLLTPHMAGPTWESYPRRFENCYANIVRVARGEAPQWVVNQEVEALR